MNCLVYIFFGFRHMHILLVTNLVNICDKHMSIQNTFLISYFHFTFLFLGFQKTYALLTIKNATKYKVFLFICIFLLKNIIKLDIGFEHKDSSFWLSPTNSDANSRNIKKALKIEMLTSMSFILAVTCQINDKVTDKASAFPVIT